MEDPKNPQLNSPLTDDGTCPYPLTIDCDEVVKEMSKVPEDPLGYIPTPKSKKR